MNSGIFPDFLKLPTPALPGWLSPPLFPSEHQMFYPGAVQAPMAQPLTRISPCEPEPQTGLYIGKRQDGTKLILNPKHYAESGERDTILASSGMGKSYLTGVLLEETLESGCMVCVIDPEGEHYTLAERYPVLIIGGEHGKIPLETDVEQVVEQMLKNRLSAVFDLSEHVDEA